MASKQEISRRLLRVGGWILLSLVYWFAAAVVTGALIMSDCSPKPAEMGACTTAKDHTVQVMIWLTIGLYILALAIEWFRPWYGLVGLASAILLCLLLFTV